MVLEQWSLPERTPSLARPRSVEAPSNSAVEAHPEVLPQAAPSPTTARSPSTAQMQSLKARISRPSFRAPVI